MTWDRPFRALSLDGGGMRGVYTATYLGAVAHAFATRRGVPRLDLGKAFDLVVGTSTGAIVGCAIAAGIDLETVVDLYRHQGAEIFPLKVPKRMSGLPWDLAARPAALARGEAALRKALQGALGATTLGELYARRGIALAVPAVELARHQSWVFKTPHLADTNHRDDNTTLVDVCLASSAAPIFRSIARVPRTDGFGSESYNYFADGGLWGNNPVLIALVEALRASEPGRPIEVLCLGSCPQPAGEEVTGKGRHRGLAKWRFGADAASLSIDAQEFAYDHIAQMLKGHLDRPCEVVRFPADKVPAALVPYLALDETSDEAIQALIRQAHADADMLNARCADANSVIGRLVCGVFNGAPAITKETDAKRVASEKESSDV